MDRGWSRRSWSGIACRRRSFNHRVKGPKGSHVVEERRIRDAEAPRIRDVHRVVRRETGDGGSHQDAMVCPRVDERAVQARGSVNDATRSEEHTSELQSPYDLVCRLLLEKK